MKTKRTKSKRQTVAKRIAKLPLPLAQQVARHKRTLQPIEAAAVEYLDALDFTRRCQAHKEIENAKAGAAACAKRWAGLEFEILTAVQDGDGAALRKLASLVETYNPSEPSADNTRSNFLAAKYLCEKYGFKITLKEFAAKLHFKGDDLSRLRLIGKEVGFPFAPDAVGRPSKTQTRKHSFAGKGVLV